MIFVTGDTHRLVDVKKLDKAHFPKQEDLTRNDYLIIAGDFGGVWTGNEKDEPVLALHEEKNYTTLFVAGNHENYDALNSYPEEIWHGGRIHRIREHVIHLMNGQIFDIDGLRFFVMGGATSVDKMFREAHVTWWPEEEPSGAEFEEALDNLDRADWKVDYIITHTCPDIMKKTTFKIPPGFITYESGVEKFLDEVAARARYKKWFAGHIHIDKEFPEYKIQILYNSIVEI